MVAINRKLLPLAGLTIAVALAGCAQPEEAAEEGPPEAGTDGGGVGFGPVVIDGRVYECDDTITLDDVCDEYVWGEDTAATPDMPSFTSEAERVTIDGRVFECDDVFNIETTGDEPQCEEYEWVED